MSEILVSHGFSLRKQRVRVHTRLLTRANAWTASGIACTILYVVLAIAQQYVWLIPALVAFAMFTDLADGRSAQKWDAHTRVGAWLDPLRDRLLGGALMGNVLLFGEPTLQLSLLAATAVAAEVAIALGNARCGEGVHLVGKLRFGAHGALGILFVADAYLGMSFVASPTAVIGGMAIASILALVAYATNWVTSGIREGHR